MEHRPVIGSFSALLESSEQRRKQAPASPVELLVLLTKLQTGGSAVKMSRLFDKAALPLDKFGELISALRAAKFIEVSGDWGNESIGVTEMGSTVAKAAQPLGAANAS